jgi:DNA polymerase-3 subunit delta'
VSYAHIRGHDQVIARLRSAVTTRPAAAYLLVGPSGVGKRLVADALAAHLLCEAATEDGACGACRHCRRVIAGTHPDLLVVVRDDDRRDLRVDQVRELIQWFVLRPLMAARKVAIVDGAHDMNEAGQNALLKTLEEPPGDAVIILVADGLAQLLPTVRSRCRRVRFDPLPATAVAGVLEQHGIDAPAAARLAARADGSVRRGLDLASADLEALRTRTLEILGDIGHAAAADLSTFAAELGRGDVGGGLDVALSWYRDLVRLVLGDASDPVANVDVRARLVSTAAVTAPDLALRFLEVVCDTVEALGRNANRTLAIETMLLELRRVARRAEQAPWTSTPT